jgi:hypothetical protein
LLSQSILVCLLLCIGCDPNPPSSTDRPEGEREEQDLYVFADRSDQNQDNQEDEGIIEEEGPVLNSILPNRTPLEGGSGLRIIGSGFRDSMWVDIGGQSCDRLVVENANRMICTLPARMSPESVDVSIRWEDEGRISTLEDILEYYQALELQSVSPQEGPTQGNTEVRLTGKGFVDTTEVRFGQELVLVSQVISETEMIVLTPPGPPSLVDVSVRNLNGNSTLSDQFRWTSPLNLNTIDPQWGWIDGGESIRLYGYGLLENSRVNFGSNEALLLDHQAPQRLVVESPSQTQAGWYPIRVQNGNGEVSIDAGFLYLDSQEGPFDVVGVTPSQLSETEGGYITIGGNGFDETVQVLLNEQPLRCSVEAPQVLRCFCPAYPTGLYEIQVQKGPNQHTLDLKYYSVVDVYSLSPTRGSITGGALVQVQGKGFSPTMELRFNDRRLILDRFVSSEEIFVKVPAHPQGIVDFTLNQGDQEIYVPEAFEYFDPFSQYGGSWGERIEHSLNVVALSIYDFMPVNEVQVDLRSFDQPREDPFITGLTNENGQTVISQQDLPTPLHVTAHKVGWEVQTFERVVSENLVMLMLPFTPPPPGEEDPPPPVEPVSIHGIVVGLSQL